jgi:hypothetical protein
VSDEKKTDRDEENREDVAQDLDLPEESAEEVKGGRNTIQKWSKQK